MAKTIGQLTQATTIASGDEFVIEAGGQTKRVAASVVRGGLVDADIDAAAAIAFSKLAALDDANILVGNGSNVATKVAMTGDVTISNAGVTSLARPFTLATSQASTSGTSIDFTGIPSWAKRITVMFDGVSTNGTSELRVRLGTVGGFVSTGYVSRCAQYDASTTGVTNATDGFAIRSNSASASVIGVVQINLVGSDTFVCAYQGSHSATQISAGCGSVALGGTLTQIRITTVNGTDTFDAGTINISYEG